MKTEKEKEIVIKRERERDHDSERERNHDSERESFSTNYKNLEFSNKLIKNISVNLF